MNINHVLVFDENVASTRYRAIIPGAALTKRGHSVTINDAPIEDAVNVYHKHFRPKLEQDFILDRPGVFDMTDNHFVTEHADHYRCMIKRATKVTCSSESLAELIKAETDKDATSIADPFEFPEMPPHFENGRKLLWYGHPSNIPSLFGIQFDCELEVVTKTKGEINPAVRVTPYTRANLIEAAERSDVCIIPFRDTEKDSMKSANRAINAIRLGLFVSASEIPSYRELKDFIWLGDIMEGVRWARGHRDEVLAMITAGQEYIAKNFSPEAIAEHWENALV